MSMIERLLKQKLREKRILENKLLISYRLNNPYLVRELIYDLMLVENEIKKLQSEIKWVKNTNIQPIFGDYIDVYNILNEQIEEVIDIINLKKTKISKMLKLQEKLFKLYNDRDMVIKLIKQQNYDDKTLKRIKILRDYKNE